MTIFKFIFARFFVTLLVTCGATALPPAAIAQILPDSTLPQSSIVTSNQNRSIITGGTESGRQLFHSFSQFSIPTGGSAYFNQPPQIQNIITRITGNESSNIDGLIRTNGTANLFFLNPNGILFGPNAKLKIGGSFTASTSDRFTLTDGSLFSASDPQAPPLLDIRVPFGIQLGKPTVGSAIETKATLSVPQNLTLQADRLVLSGELIAQNNLLLQSPNPVVGNAQFKSGGNFRVELLNGDLGQLVSPKGAIIRSFGDVSFAAYQGASLHIFAGGPVTIPGTIKIDSANVINGIVDRVTLSDGTVLEINGQSEPTLDIRAGMKLGAIGFSMMGSTVPTRADIRTGSIKIVQSDGLPRVGQVLITNQFESNLGRLGDVSIVGIDGLRGDLGGTQVSIDSRGDAKLATVLQGLAMFEQGGNARVLAQNDVRIPYINTTSVVGSGGNVVIKAGGAIDIPGGIDTSADSTGFGGTIQLLAKGDITIAGLKTSSQFGSAGTVEITSLTGAIDGSNAVIDSQVTPDGQNGGTVVLRAEKDIKLRFIGTSGGFAGGSGDITLTSRSGDISINQGGLFTVTIGPLNSGAIRVNAGRNVVITQSDLISSVIFNQGGQGGDMTIVAGNSILLDQVALLSTSGLLSTDISNASNNLGLRMLAFGPDYSYYRSSGSAGNIRLTAGQNIIEKGSIISTANSYYSLGNAGNIEISAGNQVTLQRGLSYRFPYPGLYAFSRGEGNAGDITIDANSLSVLGSSIETGLSFEAIGTSGDIKINVRDHLLLDGDGWSAEITAPIKPSGLSAIALGDKGNIKIHAGSLTLRNGTNISTAVGDINTDFVTGGTATGNAGNIELNVDRELSLSQSFISSRVFANGTGNAGKISIQAKSIDSQQSIIVSDTSGKGNANTISLNTNHDITLSDSDVSSAVQPGAMGQGRDILIKARSLLLMNGAQINTVSSGQGAAGNVKVEAENVRIEGPNVTLTPINFLYGWQPIDGVFSTRPPNTFSFTTAPDFVDGVSSGIFSSTNSSSNGGSITVNAQTLTVGQGGAIDARTTSIGDGGRISINSNQVNLRAGGQLSAVTTGRGDGGTIVLNSDQIQISGSDPTFFDRLAQYGTSQDIYGKVKVSHQGAISGIFASTTVRSTGKGGKITIATRDLRLTENGKISVNSQGLGDGGRIEIASQTLKLDQANLFAKTASGVGGNIFLTIQNLLTLRHNSQISATANANGNGGNIDIKIPNGLMIAVLNENSDITANANKGRGGSINITARSILGIAPRDRLTPLNDITASSDLGINGSINFNSLAPEPNQNLQELPQLVENSDQIDQTCSPKARSNSFVVTGKGGLPPNPSESLNATQPWRSTPSKAITTEIPKPTVIATPILEATHWVQHSDGSITLDVDESGRLSARSAGQLSNLSCKTGAR